VLEAVQHRAFTGGHLFVFDVRDPTRPRHGVLATSAVGLISPGLRLPPFAVVARLGPGFLQQLMAPLVERLAGPGEPVDLDDAAFEARFRVLSLAPGGAAAVRAALTPPARAALARAPLFVLIAAGDAVALQGNAATPELRGDELAMVRGLLDAAQALPASLEAGVPA
jgi:hypothetical protein